MMNNDIYPRQQEDRFLRMRAAARQLYSEEKRWNAIWTVLSLAVAVLGTGALAMDRTFSAYVVLAAMIAAVIELRALPFIQKKRELAANIQEAHDRALLRLPKDETLPEPPLAEVINEAALRYLRHASPRELQGLKLWYSKVIVDQPLSVARFICQKENLWWNSSLRSLYAWLIWIAVAGILFALLAAGIFFHWSIPLFLTGPFLLFFPVLSAGWRNGQTHRDASQRLQELNALVDAWLQAARDGAQDETTLMWLSRQLQTAIFYQRRADAPVVDWLYRLAQKRMEALANTPGQFGED